MVLLRLGRLGRALRWPFVSASGLSFMLGAVMVEGNGNWGAAGLGLLAVVALHLCANLLNDVADSDSGIDRFDPTYYGLFGGSKLLVQGALSRRVYLSLAAGLTAIAAAAVGGLAAWHRSGLPLLTAGAAGLLAAGYSLPPVQLVHRGLGELTVGLLFGPAAVLAGHYTRSGDVALAECLGPGTVAGLLTVGILLANQVPDADGDCAGSKRTLVVRVGRDNGWRLYATAVGAAFLLLGGLLWRGNVGRTVAVAFVLAPLAGLATAIMRRCANDKSALLTASRIAISVQGGVLLAMILDRFV